MYAVDVSPDLISSVTDAVLSEVATKLIWLALRNITATWARASPHWKAAMNQFAILYKERFTQAA